MVALLNLLMHLVDLDAGLVCVLGAVADLLGNMLDRIYQGIHFVGLLRSALGQRLRAAGNMLRTVAYLDRYLLDLGHRII